MTAPKMSASQLFVYYRTYSRWVDELQRRETWNETVDRYFTFMKSKFKDKVPASIWDLCYEKVSNMEVMPSMRALWAAGPALEKNNIIGYNCCSMAFKDLQSPVELFYILMCGAGVGFSVEKAYIDQMPEVRRFTGQNVGTHIVGDSREGWATALKLGLETWFDGNDVSFDFSQVRPMGARLKTMGGRASGPEPLRKLLDFVRDTVNYAQGRKLTSVEWLDIGNMIGEAVVVGGVRRSSEISYSDLDDLEMRHAKDWPFPAHRAMSNNTAVYKTKPDMIVFMKEWTALAASGTGERGIFNLEAVNKASPRREKSEHLRSNPCGEIALRADTGEFCVSGDTTLLTQTGVTKISSSVDKQINIWNGKEWTEVTPRKTGTDIKLYRVNFSDGSFLDCTEDHGLSVKDRFQDNFKKVSIKTIMAFSSKYLLQSEPFSIKNEGGKDIKDAYTLGFAIGDECAYDECFSWSRKSVLEFFAGMADADGSVTKTGGIHICLSGYERANQLQLLLSKQGIRSSVCLVQKAGTKNNTSVRKKDSWRLQITQCKDIPCIRLNTSGGHEPKFKSKFQTIRDIQELPGVHDTFCFVEPKEHKAVFNNVLTYQCNLSEIVVKAGDKFDDLVEKAKVAVWLGNIQACLTDFPFLRPSFKEACDKERLLGVSLTGQMDNPKLLTDERLEDLRDFCVKTCRKASKALGINMSAAITTGKPSGTTSQLCNTASGAHPRFGKFYIRRYRISATDPLFFMMKDQGLKFSPENGQGPESVEEKRKALIDKGRSLDEAKALVPDWNESQVMTWVVAFPEAAPKACLTRHDVDAISQLEWYLKIKKYWCEHNQSITVYVKDDEWLKVGSWVYEHFDDIIGISFLPFSGGSYKQAPYEDLTEDQYKQMLKDFPKIDYSHLHKYETDDNTTGAKALACSSDGCELR